MTSRGKITTSLACWLQVFSVNSTASNNNNAALISQSGFQKETTASANAHYSRSTPPSASPSTVASIVTNSPVKNEMVAFFTQ
ncbi:hypothetical protein Hanom_Chr04g00345941 [Helianthus anomalus]